MGLTCDKTKIFGKYTYSVLEEFFGSIDQRVQTSKLYRLIFLTHIASFPYVSVDYRYF